MDFAYTFQSWILNSSEKCLMVPIIFWADLVVCGQNNASCFHLWWTIRQTLIICLWIMLWVTTIPRVDIFHKLPIRPEKWHGLPFRWTDFSWLIQTLKLYSSSVATSSNFVTFNFLVCIFLFLFSHLGFFFPASKPYTISIAR